MIFWARRLMPTPDSAPDALPLANVPADALVRVGYLFRPHGVKGEVKVNPDATDDPDRFTQWTTVYAGHKPDAVRSLTIASARMQQTKRGLTVIVGFEEIGGRTAAEAIAKQNLYVHEEALDLGDGQAFVHDIIGMDVITEDGDAIGTVTAIMPSPGHDILVVARPHAGEALIPAVDEFVVALDLNAAHLVIRPIEGLL